MGLHSLLTFGFSPIFLSSTPLFGANLRMPSKSRKFKNWASVWNETSVRIPFQNRAILFFHFQFDPAWRIHRWWTNSRKCTWTSWLPTWARGAPSARTTLPNCSWNSSIYGPWGTNTVEPSTTSPSKRAAFRRCWRNTSTSRSRWPTVEEKSGSLAAWKSLQRLEKQKIQ